MLFYETVAPKESERNEVKNISIYKVFQIDMPKTKEFWL